MIQQLPSVFPRLIMNVKVPTGHYRDLVTIAQGLILLIDEKSKSQENLHVQVGLSILKSETIKSKKPPTNLFFFSIMLAESSITDLMGLCITNFFAGNWIITFNREKKISYGFGTN